MYEASFGAADGGGRRITQAVVEGDPGKPAAPGTPATSETAAVPS